MQGPLPDWQVIALLAQVFFILPRGRSPSVKPVRLPVPEEIFWHGRLRLTRAADAARGFAY